MRYLTYFDGPIDSDALRRTLERRFGIPPSAVYVGRLEDRPVTADRPVVVVTLPEGPGGFRWTLMGDRELAEATGLSELDLARVLAHELNLRALVDDGTNHPDRWILVARDGSHGPVIVDEDAANEGDLRIVYAEVPIPGEPDIRLRLNGYHGKEAPGAIR
ncbi:MAG TPA: hypothetical protein VIL34_08945 [Actinopolymorphaceae bacterium]|jgi:hypothetical protein